MVRREGEQPIKKDSRGLWSWVWFYVSFRCPLLVWLPTLAECSCTSLLFEVEECRLRSHWEKQPESFSQECPMHNQRGRRVVGGLNGFGSALIWDILSEFGGVGLFALSLQTHVCLLSGRMGPLRIWGVGVGGGIWAVCVCVCMTDAVLGDICEVGHVRVYMWVCVSRGSVLT